MKETALTIITLPDYLPPEAAKISIARRAEQIRTYLASADDTWELHIGYVCLLGCELLIAKEQVGHGKFLDWIKQNFPEHGERSLRRHMAFLSDVAAKSEEVRALLSKTSVLASQDGPDKTLLKQLCNAVAANLDGKSITQYLRDTGRCRELVHQKDRDNSRKQTPAESEAARKEAALAFADLLIANDLTFCAENKSTHLLHADLDTAKIKEILDAGVTRNRICKNILQARKQKPAKKGGRK